MHKVLEILETEKAKINHHLRTVSACYTNSFNDLSKIQLLTKLIKQIECIK